MLSIIIPAAKAKAVAEMARLGKVGKASAKINAPSAVRLPWGSWNDYPKVTVGGREYAQIGERMYSRHAADRMQPSGLGAPVGTYGPGRNVIPNIVEHIISAGDKATATVNGVKRTSYTMGNVRVWTEDSGKTIVTILRIGSQ